jgi:sodium/proline symporter
LSSQEITKVVVLCIYLLMMLGIGFLFFKRTKNFSDYILGGRKLNSWTAALSAQASDMSGWLLLGLPGAAYASGLSSAWIAIGLAAGTYVNWRFVAKRLRVFTEKLKDSLTLADYFENRFEDDTRLLRVISSVVIIIFFTVYTSAQFSAGGKLFETLMGIEYQTALIIGGIVIIGYTFLGGFMAVSITDFIQGTLMFFALLIVPFVAISELGGFSSAFLKMKEVDNHYLSLFKSTGGGNLAAVTIVSSIAWGLGYFGQPHILARFMAIKSANDVKKARIIANVWVVITLAAGVFVGLIGRVYLNNPLDDKEKVFMLMVDDLFFPVLAGVMLAAILAASMSTADSQLLVTASSIAEDLYKPFFRKNASDIELIWVGRIAVALIAVIGIIIAFDPNSSVFGLVSYAWAGLGAAFGPVIVVSLFWKRMNKWGALAGMLGGAITVILWKMVAANASAGSWLTVYEIVPAMIVAFIAIFVTSLLTKAPNKNIVSTFSKIS